MSILGGASLRGCAGALIESAARVVILALSLAIVAMSFATRAEASLPGDDMLLLASGGVEAPKYVARVVKAQTGSPAASTETIAGGTVAPPDAASGSPAIAALGRRAPERPVSSVQSAGSSPTPQARAPGANGSPDPASGASAKTSTPRAVSLPP